VFILHSAGSRWTWASRGSVPEKTVSFTPAQFGSADFTVSPASPVTSFVAVRRL
jgi:hypothetical protein